MKLLQNPHVFLTFDRVHNPLRLPHKATSDRPKVARTLQFLTFSLGNVPRATTACAFSTSQLPKVVRTCGGFNIFIWKCASCHNGVHLFDISTSKSGPKVRRFFFVFYLQMCFAPQRRAILHLSFSSPL